MFGHLTSVAKIVLAFIVTLVLLPVHIAGRLFSKPLRRRIEMTWHQAICYLIGLRIEVRGQLAHPDDHGVLIAANHVSYTDVLVLGSLAPVSFIAKKEVESWPLFGTLAKWQDCVFVDRNVRFDVRAQAGQINQRLAEGDNLVLFAEGTTSDGNFVLPFKSSLFGAIGVGADMLASPIQPVSIAYTAFHGLPMGRFDRPLAAWPGDIGLFTHLMRLLRHGEVGVVVSFGDPIVPGDQMNRKQITALAQERVAEMTSLALRGL